MNVKNEEQFLSIRELTAGGMFATLIAVGAFIKITLQRKYQRTQNRTAGSASRSRAERNAYAHALGNIVQSYGSN